MRRILLTSTGFTNKNLEKLFLEHIGKSAKNLRVIFVPTDAGVLDENIITYDLDRAMDITELCTFDAIYFCGGSESHLMDAINRIGFAPILMEAVNEGLFYIGVSAGSMIASASVSNGLSIIPNPLEPHCEENITPDGPLPAAELPVNISDDQAVWITDDEAVILQ